MTYQVRILCGGNQGSFILFGREYPTRSLAEKAGENSICVQTQGWDYDIEEVTDA